MTEYNHQEDEPMISDTALDDLALHDLFAELGALADRPTPPIGDELAALFAGTTPLAAARSRRNKAAKAGLIGLVTAGVLAGGVTAAAAANELPAPAQRIVSRVINTLTPLEIPNPDEQGPVEHQTDTDIDDNGDQPGQEVDQPGQEVDQPGQEVDQPGQDGTEQGDQSNGQRDQSSGDQSDDQAGGSDDQGVSDGGADQQGSGQGTTGGTGTGDTGATGTSGNGSGGSATTGGQQGTNGSGQN